MTQNKLSHEEKLAWFRRLIEERTKNNPFTNQEDLIAFVHLCRKQFKATFGRDVPGSFVRQLFESLGIKREYSETTRKKRDYMFALMDKNKNFRDNKTQCRKAVEKHFGEEILGIVFDELWSEYHREGDHPEPEMNVDIYGQPNLFG